MRQAAERKESGYDKKANHRPPSGQVTSSRSKFGNNMKGKTAEDYVKKWTKKEKKIYLVLLKGKNMKEK